MSALPEPLHQPGKLCLVLAALAVLMTACQPGLFASNTSTAASPPSQSPPPTHPPISTSTPAFTASPTSAATQPLQPNTPTVMSSPTFLPAPNPGQTTSVGMGGYSFQALPGYLVEINVSQATISDPSGRILISMTGAVPAQMQPVERLLADFLDNLAGNFSPFQASAPYPLTLAGVDGLAVDVSGVMFNEPFSGRVAVVTPAGTRLFTILALGTQSGSADYWALQGQPAFDAVLASLRFFEPTDSACLVSSDPAYGYTPASPIQVGGGQLSGAAREQSYLANLRGPSYELVEVQSQGVQPAGETTLDVFSISYPGLDQPVQLYLDPNHYKQPQAPAGLKCPQPFNLPPP